MAVAQCGLPCPLCRKAWGPRCLSSSTCMGGMPGQCGVGLLCSNAMHGDAAQGQAWPSSPTLPQPCMCCRIEQNETACCRIAGLRELTSPAVARVYPCTPCQAARSCAVGSWSSDALVSCKRRLQCSLARVTCSNMLGPPDSPCSPACISLCSKLLFFKSTVSIVETRLLLHAVCVGASTGKCYAPALRLLLIRPCHAARGNQGRETKACACGPVPDWSRKE